MACHCCWFNIALLIIIFCPEDIIRGDAAFIRTLHTCSYEMYNIMPRAAPRCLNSSCRTWGVHMRLLYMM
eukprot:4064493-Amphidinium_carterae.1